MGIKHKGKELNHSIYKYNERYINFLVFQVDFDKTKHLAESTIKKRSQEREKLIQKEREKDEAERRKAELEELKRAEEL